ncbi:MAG: TrkA family potassium uptake protein [Candidatus Diapherotrites archaeon]|jgi:trk system potassium uptake protein|nr:TrkA family potassium uptake protein [Candidatus Diapherotrites archaeon]MBT4597382.1 TrkA family potassium uptake protein [Candidatus Diapherotrites archaeon]
MYIVIIGAGSLGYYLAHLLLEENHECVVIDKDSAKCDKIANDLDIVAINGDATDPKTLGKVDISEADAVVALTAQDETNMVICLLAKDLGAKQVGARISRIDYNEKILRKLGIDVVIHPEAAAAGYIEELITKPEVLDLAFLSRGNAEIMEFEVTAKSKLAGKKVKDIENPSGSAIIGFFEKGELVIPSPEMKIKKGTKILIIAKRSVANSVRKKVM